MFYTGTNFSAQEEDHAHTVSLLMATIESTTDAILVVDRAGVISLYNEIFVQLWKIPEEVMRERNDRLAIEFVSSQVRDSVQFQKKIEMILESPDEKTYDVIELKDRRTFERYSQPQRLGGEIVGTVWSFRDITEKHRNQERALFLCEVSEILASSLDYSQTLRSVTQLAVPSLAEICVVNLLQEDGTLKQVSAVGLPTDTLLGQHQPSYLRIGENVDSYLSTSASELHYKFGLLPEHHFLSGIAVPLLVHGQTLGEMVFLSSNENCIYDQYDLGLAEEIAHLAALAIDNARLYQDARSAIKFRQDLLAMVSHELRNSLTSILLSAEVLQSPRAATMKAEAKDQSLKRISSSGLHMQRLIQDLLDQAKIEGNRFSINTNQQDVSAFLKWMGEALTPLAQTKNISLVLQDCPTDAQSNFDRDRIFQVFSNLVGNAIKFSAPDSEIAFGAVMKDNQVLFYVKDHGQGMNKEQVSQLFQRYWQAESKSGIGNGLGLSIAKEIIEAHQGKIWAESEMGYGTSFYFILPGV